MIVTPTFPIMAGHVNEAGVTYAQVLLDKTRIAAEELEHLEGVVVSARFSANPYSLAISGAEALTEDRDAFLRGLLAVGGVGPIPLEGAGARLMWHPGKWALRAGAVAGTEWNDVNVGERTIALGIDTTGRAPESVLLGHYLEAAVGGDRAVLIGLGMDTANPLATSTPNEVLIATRSDVPTIRVTDSGKVSGQVGLVGVGLGATAPTAFLDVAASTSTRASLRIRPGVAPSSPNDGDLWVTGSGLFGKVGGTSYDFLNLPPAAHASTHWDGGSDELEVEDLASRFLGPSAAVQVLRPDGAGGVEFTRGLASVATTSTSDATTTSLVDLGLADDKAYLLTVKIIARRTDAAARAAYVRRALIYREAAGSATLQGPIDSPFTRESSGSWNATIDTSGVNFRVRVTGEAGASINWWCNYWLEEVS